MKSNLSESREYHSKRWPAFHTLTSIFHTLQLVLTDKGWFKFKYVLSFVAVQWRRDSAVIKEEIKSFLANRRISQAVVAQVTGEYPVKHWHKEPGSHQTHWMTQGPSSSRDQSESDFPLAPTAGIGPQWAEETGLLPLVPAGENQPR